MQTLEPSWQLLPAWCHSTAKLILQVNVVDFTALLISMLLWRAYNSLIPYVFFMTCSLLCTN
jgi:hypothetical protein